MKEFMLLIRNQAESKNSFSPEQNLQFLEACRVYIEKLMKNGNLKSAQPLVREGKMIAGTKDSWNDVSEGIISIVYLKIY